MSTLTAGGAMGALGAAPGPGPAFVLLASEVPGSDGDAGADRLPLPVAVADALGAGDLLRGFVCAPAANEYTATGTMSAIITVTRGRMRFPS
jgi:hypothetical protein